MEPERERRDLEAWRLSASDWSGSYWQTVTRPAESP